MTSVTAPTPGRVIPPDFSLCRGGPLYRWLAPLRSHGGLVRPGLAIALLTWVPLAVLTALEGALGQGPRIPFWQSVGTHARFLLAIPLFFSAEAVFDARIGDVLRRIVQIGLVAPSDEPAVTKALRQAIRSRDARAIEAGLAILTAVAIWSGLRTDLPLDVSTWRHTADGGLTLAGWWYTVVALPIFQFLFWRWGWRLLIWTRLLWHLSRLDLQLIPTHPDTSGGLAVLGVAHVDLAPLSFAASAILSASYAEQILFADVRLTSFAISIASTVVGSTAHADCAPLFFAPKLIEVKQRALLEYGTLAAALYARVRGQMAPHRPTSGRADTRPRPTPVSRRSWQQLRPNQEHVAPPDYDVPGSYCSLAAALPFRTADSAGRSSRPADYRRREEDAESVGVSLSEGLRPSDSPTRVLTRRAGALGRGPLASARSLFMRQHVVSVGPCSSPIVVQ